jgi:hypothetical protein
MINLAQKTNQVPYIPIKENRKNDQFSSKNQLPFHITPSKGNKETRKND